MAISRWGRPRGPLRFRNAHRPTARSPATPPGSSATCRSKALRIDWPNSSHLKCREFPFIAGRQTSKRLPPTPCW